MKIIILILHHIKFQDYVFLIFPHHMYIEQLQLLSKSQHILSTFIPDEVRKIMI